MRVFLLLVTLLSVLPAQANEIVGALSQNRVSLTANFSGSEILIFGAIRRDPEEVLAGRQAAEEQAAQAAAQEGVAPDALAEQVLQQASLHQSEFDIIIVIEGPRQTASVWRKERRAGIWVNVDAVNVASVPSFYAVASTAPLPEILSPEADAAYRISVEEAIGVDDISGDVSDPSEFADALLRIREASGHYLELSRWVHLEREVLFRANVQLPANIIDGAYITRMYLVRDGEVESRYRTAIFVRKDGLERWLHQLAYDQPFLYGLLALVIAILAGYGASAVFRVIRNS